MTWLIFPPFFRLLLVWIPSGPLLGNLQQFPIHRQEAFFSHRSYKSTHYIPYSYNLPSTILLINVYCTNAYIFIIWQSLRHGKEERNECDRVRLSKMDLTD